MEVIPIGNLWRDGTTSITSSALMVAFKNRISKSNLVTQLVMGGTGAIVFTAIYIPPAGGKETRHLFLLLA
jgi:hypothetical protein